MNTFQSALVSRLLEAPVPHQTMSSLPAAPALTQGARAVLVPEPLLTRAGVVQVPPLSLEPVRKMFLPFENTTCRLPAASIARLGKTFPSVVPTGAWKISRRVKLTPPSVERAR